jgi:hypothetical protein
MTYKRSSFFKWLIEVCQCDVFPLPNNPKVIVIKYLNEKVFVGVDSRDIIDYEEIYSVYKRLLLPELPGDTDLVKINI